MAGRGAPALELDTVEAWLFRKRPGAAGSWYVGGRFVFITPVIIAAVSTLVSAASVYRRICAYSGSAGVSVGMPRAWFGRSGSYQWITARAGTLSYRRPVPVASPGWARRKWYSTGLPYASYRTPSAASGSCHHRSGVVTWSPSNRRRSSCGPEAGSVGLFTITPKHSPSRSPVSTFSRIFAARPIRSHHSAHFRSTAEAAPSGVVSSAGVPKSGSVPTQVGGSVSWFRGPVPTTSFRLVRSSPLQYPLFCASYRDRFRSTWRTAGLADALALYPSAFAQCFRFSSVVFAASYEPRTGGLPTLPAPALRPVRAPVRRAAPRPGRRASEPSGG